MTDWTRRTRGTRLALTLTVMLAAAAAVALAEEWKTYSYPPDGFSAVFPTEPSLGKRNIDTDNGTFELRSYVGQSGPEAFFIGVCDYDERVASKSPDAVLDGARDGAVSNTKSHLTREKKITLGVYKGLDFEAESADLHFDARIYIVGTTLYQEVVVSAIGSPHADAGRFLDSFQLIPRKRD